MIYGILQKFCSVDTGGLECSDFRNFAKENGEGQGYQRMQAKFCSVIDMLQSSDLMVNQYQGKRSSVSLLPSENSRIWSHLIVPNMPTHRRVSQHSLDKCDSYLRF
jgi:hypothetical protein